MGFGYQVLRATAKSLKPATAVDRAKANRDRARRDALIMKYGDPKDKAKLMRKKGIMG
ncbi:MAG: hypothetical protein M1374_05945 [Firmicutes bacterium]|jgi:hypothetical protein|nr:hypothetical protein [Bacillota bacterium]